MPCLDLKARLAHSKPIVAPGVYDALSALIAERAGFEALYVSGASLSYTQLGRPDYGLVSVTELVQAVGRIADRVSVPLIVDADTGFGNELNVRRTVHDLEQAGAAMIQIEDQTFPKRCGQLAGKSVIPIDEMCTKLRTALEARRSERTLIMARTDAASVLGLDDALARAQAYVDCGVDALFIEALRDDAAMMRACEQFAHQLPMLANVVEGGHTPLDRATDLAQKGFRIIIYPGGSARFVAKQMSRFYTGLAQNGTTSEFKAEMFAFDDLFTLLDG